MLEEAKKKFSLFLKQKDLKLTHPRLVILDEALKAKGHFSADQLLDLSKKRDRNISKATLYRTLTLLTESEVLEEHDFGDGKKSYERRIGHSHHDHFICVSCKRIFEFENEDIEKLQEREAAKIGFQILFHSLKLFGQCQTCRKKK